jgi:hypothetical protein
MRFNCTKKNCRPKHRLLRRLRKRLLPHARHFCVCFGTLLPLAAAALSFANCATYNDTGFFTYTGMGYGHEKITPDPVIENNGLNYLAGLGYDFGPVSANLTVDVMLFSVAEYHGYMYESSKIESTFNLGAGINLGVKIFESDFFDLTLPVGVLFRGSTLKLAHEYSAFSRDYADYNISFNYFYLNIESGLIPSLQFAEKWFLLVPFYIGYPVFKDVKTTNYNENKYDAFNCTVGICVKRLF